MMKPLVNLCLLGFIASAVASEEDWEKFKYVHGKSYSNAKEELYRKTIYEINSKYVEEHNKRFQNGHETFDLKMNRFGDMTNEEFVAQMTGVNPLEWTVEKVFIHFPDRERADTVDWRDKGVVTPVKDQGMLGSATALSTTGAVESSHAIKTGDLVRLSEQQIVECEPESAFLQRDYDYVVSVGGLESEADYPCEGMASECKFDASKIIATITSYEVIPFGDEETQANAVNDVGPVSVCIDAGNLSFQLYSSGIYYEPNCNAMGVNHAVLAIGYGTETDKDYWLLKNSWGAFWGENGYMKLARNMDNHCGIASQSIYPIA